MRPLRYAPVWLTVAWLLVAAVVVMSLMPDDGQFDDLALYNDKAAHVLAYFVLMMWFSGIYSRERYAWIGGALLLLGVGLELMQGALGYRGMSVGDLVANVFGVVLGWGFAAWGAGAWCLRVERWLAPSG